MEISRYLADSLSEKLSYPYVHIIFGARQTGKTTLLTVLVPTPCWPTLDIAWNNGLDWKFIGVLATLSEEH